jgi:hypothetical protein
MNSKSVTVSLWWKLHGASQLLIPRYTPRGWWECDLWRLTKSGYVEEYEIKLTVADFNQDAKKEEPARERFNRQSRQWEPTPARNKHLILSGTTEGPSRFYFVLPKEVLDRVQIPEWAGAIVVSGHSVWQTKQAPKRHQDKWEGDRDLICRTFMYRFWDRECSANGQPIPPFELTGPGLESPE